jgi:hypothetical protein
MIATKKKPGRKGYGKIIIKIKKEKYYIMNMIKKEMLCK